MKNQTRHEFLAAQALTTGAADPGRYARKDGGEPTLAELGKSMREVATKLKERDSSMDASMKSLQEEVKATGEISKETQGKLEEQAKSAGELQARLLELEQKAAEFHKAPKDSREPSVGQRFVDQDAWKSWAKNQTSSKFQMGCKSITSLTSGTGGAGDLVQEMRVPGIIRQPDRMLTIRDLISAGRTSSNTVEYVSETGFTNAAAPVAEGTLKPESDLSFELQTAPVRTIAHWIDATKQILDDAPMLMSYIDTRLRYGLGLAEEDQLLAGDGTGQNLFGLIPQATAFDDARAMPGDTRIDIIRRAMTQVRLAEYRADAIVMHPNDWEEIELTKTTEGAYVWGNPSGLLSPTIWGLPVIDTVAVDPGEFLIGAFRMAAQVWDREDANVEVSTETGDNFKKNMVTIRAEERLALTVYRPEALVTGDFATVVTGG